MRLLVLLAGLCLLTVTAPALAQVEADAYDSFWLWSGVRPQPVLAYARNLYILQGQIGSLRRARHAGAQFIAQGISVPKLAEHPGDIWLVYRAQTLDWPPQAHALLLGQLRRWRQAGNRVVGIQIDFDAPTRQLPRYVAFLRELRQRLPRQYKLSVTGLLDWSNHGDPRAINQLRGIIDELVIQTYQGRQTIPDYARYLPGTRRLQLPFKIGLIQGGAWQAPAGLADAPWFRGYVVFLQNP